MGVTVTLSWFEMYQAAQVGAMRQIEALKRRRPDRYGFAGSGWEIHICGAAAELAVAKATDSYWNSLAARLENLPGDAGRMQVRWRSQPLWDLIVHPDDADEVPFVLVVGDAPTLTIVGWILGGDAKRDEWWKDPAGGRPAFFVPQEALSPLDQFMREFA